jgi:hypothetical protein
LSHDSAGTRLARDVLVKIANDHIEESFFRAGDNLAARTAQFDLVAPEVEDRRRGLKAVILTGAILVVAVLLLALFLPAPTSQSAHGQERDDSAQL